MCCTSAVLLLNERGGRVALQIVVFSVNPCVLPTGTMGALARVNLRRKFKEPSAAGVCRVAMFRLAQHRAFQIFTGTAAGFYLLACAAEAMAPTNHDLLTTCAVVQVSRLQLLKPQPQCCPVE